MRVDDFDFDLPEHLIALRPARPRDSARLLVVDPTRDGFTDRTVSELPGLLRPGDVLVFNDTKVIHAALKAQRAARQAGSPAVEIDVNLHKRVDEARWRAFARPGKRLRVDDPLTFGDGFGAVVEDKSEGGEVLLRFDRSGAALDEAIAAAGAAPLPPYIADRRAPDAADEDDYQTVYAARAGSVAAPTAGLQFTHRFLEALDRAGVQRLHVTLLVGAGTFLPVKVEDTGDHVMHSEWREIEPATAQALTAAKREGRRIVAVGTTALRTLESSSDGHGGVAAGAGDTDIFITPGYRFQVVDGLWTNFHLPRSTLFMLVGALSGRERMRAAYAHAIGAGYRFYSYGDASLLWRSDDRA
jgi:S-adenosylmethionine:tRNA ribosyltransferase-isomerase